MGMSEPADRHTWVIDHTAYYRLQKEEMALMMICAAHRYASSLSLPDRYDGVTSLSVRGKTYRVTNLHTY